VKHVGRRALGAVVLFLATLVCGWLQLASAATAQRATTTAVQRLVIYSVATREQFLNHADDRARGKGNNPFGNFKDVTTNGQERSSGPLAGDRAVFAFELFKEPTLKNPIGSATLTCQYGFNRYAFCDAYYRLKGGQLVGEGAFSFDAPTFELVIVGGSDEYLGVTGDMKAAPAVRHTQRLEFRLIPHFAIPTRSASSKASSSG
jgi:hypothetical protein